MRDRTLAAEPPPSPRARPRDSRDPDLLARQLGLLIEGAVIHMEVFREPQVARTADDAAQKLVDAAMN